MRESDAAEHEGLGRSRTATLAAGLVGALTAVAVLGSAQRVPTAAPTITDLSLSAPAVPRYGLLSVEFDVRGSSARVPFWPFDQAPPDGIEPGAGISVDAVLWTPDGHRYVQPAYRAQRYLEGIRDGRDWHLPTGQFTWHVRFSPNQVGEWRGQIVARDRGGRAESAPFAFRVNPSERPGFVRVARADRRYFEFDNGQGFTALGFQFPEYLDDPATRGAPAYARLARYGVNFVRLDAASLFGTAWTTWIGSRQQYRGYLPVGGLLPVRDETGRVSLAMRLDREKEGDTGWFDACRLQAVDGSESIEPNRRYRLRVEFMNEAITGPRDPHVPTFGLVARMGATPERCADAATGLAVTRHGGAGGRGWQWLEGSWSSGNRHFLPRLTLALENVVEGAAYVRSVSLREERPDGGLGPELMVRSSFAYDEYVPDEQAWALDEIVRAAEEADVYLKVVVGEKEDELFFKIADDGRWITEGPDNPAGYYGLGRRMNRTRWLQQAWWRYLQARWGYSTNIHSWELLNEGDPSSARHYTFADEFGKFMRCRVFGVEPGPGDGRPCTFEHPNRHLVTTSTWHSFPAREFWANPAFPNLDYADLHAYVSTSEAPLPIRDSLRVDTAEYHVWHSQHVRRSGLAMPVVRGEAGIDAPGRQTEDAGGLQRDRRGIWLHNLLWAGLDAGGLHEVYWWNSHIWSRDYDHRGAYLGVARFMRDIPLHRGGFTDWAGRVSNPRLRVVGQKHLSAGLAHLWIQNRAHTWVADADGVSPPPETGEVLLPGFRGGASYVLEWWDTYAALNRPTSETSLVAEGNGDLRVPVVALTTDVAVKVRPGPAVTQP